MSNAWLEFLEKHDRPRGEMDAGMLFGSDAAPCCRVREITQVAYRLNLVRPEVAFIDTKLCGNHDFVGFFVAQMVPSVKKIYGSFSDDLKRKFSGDVSFFDGKPKECDMLWWRSMSYPGEIEDHISMVSRGGIVVFESILDGDYADTFHESLSLGREAEAIIDRSECDAVSSLVAAGKPAPKTKYTNWLQHEGVGGYGMLYV